jgi:hypothetical protein
MPMAMVLELFAEVAAAVNPGKKLVRISNLKMLRGVTFANGNSKILRVQAAGRNGTLDLKLRSDDTKDFHYTGRAELGSARKPAKTGPGLELIKRAQLPLSIAAIYDTWLFHGNGSSIR